VKSGEPPGRAKAASLVRGGARSFLRGFPGEERALGAQRRRKTVILASFRDETDLEAPFTTL
jgi:hypothetical protein